MKLYCPTCGGATNYSLDKPKFCASCGESFTIAGSTTPRRITKTQPRKVYVEPEIEEEEEVFEIPQINKLQYNLEGSQQFMAVPLKDVAGTEEEGKSDGYVREADPTYNTASITEDFMKDAGSSRTPDAET